MEKSKLLNFISKYHLGKLIQSVAWNVNGGLSTRFISDDKCVVGEVKLKSFQGDDWKFGVYNTDLLVSLLGVLGNTVNFQVNGAGDKAFSLTIDDKSTTVNYMLADLAVIPPAPDLKELPNFELDITITKEFIDKFIKAKSALSDIEKFTVLKNEKLNKYQIVLGSNPQPETPDQRGCQPPGRGPFGDHPQRTPRQRTREPGPLRQRTSTTRPLQAAHLQPKTPYARGARGDRR